MPGNNAGKQSQNINNIGMFDLSRGTLMLLVIIGHSMILFFKYWEVEGELSIFLMPLLLLKVFIYGLIPMFFMMSGYGFRKAKKKKRIFDSVRQLLKPYLCVAIITTIAAVLKKVIIGKPIIEALKYQAFPFLLGLCPGETYVFGWYTASIGPMWFLIALAIAWLLLNLFFYVESEVVRVICIVAVTALVTQLPFYKLIPFCILQALCCTGYLYIGYCIKKKQLLTNKLSIQTYILFGLILLYAVLFGNIEVSQNVWELEFFDYVASCIAGYFMLRISVMFENYDGKIFKVLRKCGKYSLYILCVHTVEYLVVPWESVAEKLESHMLLGILFVVIFRGIIIGVGCWAVDKIVRMCRRKKV